MDRGRKKDYLLVEGGMDKKQFLKRSADWLEKISVASVAVGLFQGEEKVIAGFIVGLLAIIGSHILDNIWRRL
jgi:hypothetical protein